MSSDRAGSSGEPLAKVAKRDADESDDNDNDRDKYHNQKMLAKLECPVCLHPMQPPIYQCSIGHSYCNECEPQLQKCPICPADKTKTRSFGMEGMADDVLYQCRGLGCKESYLISEKRNHSADCIGRIMTCFKTECNFSGTAVQLMEHVFENTSIHKSFNLEDKFHLRQYDISRFRAIGGYSNYIKFDGQLFKARLSKFGDEYGFCIMLCGRKSVASNYQFEVKFSSSALEARKLWHTSGADIHCDVDMKPGCCVALFAEGSPMENGVVERVETKRWLTLSFKIMRYSGTH